MRKLILYSKSEDYFKDVLKDIKEAETKICYISFNKSNDLLREEFKKNKIKNEDIFVIDAITKTISKKRIKARKNTKFISEAYRLDDISDAIKKAIKMGYDLIVLDSLSDLLAYYPESNEKILLEFVESFANDKDTELLFVVKRADEEHTLVEKIYSLFNVYQKEIVPFGI